MSMRPVCVRCQQTFKPEKNGVYVLERDSDGEPYKVWHADMWRCQECGTYIIAGFGQKALSVRHHEDFDRYKRDATYEFTDE